jgi:hypothetical protein
MKTKEEILAKITDRTVDNIVNGCINVTASQALKAMQSYHRQFLPSPQETIKDESPVLPSEITDEEIRKAADDAYKGTDGLLDAYGTAGFEKGANWYRSQLKSQKATPQVSDMDIRNAFIEKYKGLDGLAEAYKEAGFIEGAKAMRDGKIKTQ